MGRVVRIDKVAVVDGVRILTVDPGNGSLDDVELFLPPGEDGLPVAGDLAVVVDAVGNAGPVAVATLDEEQPDGAAGGKRIYARDASGAIISWVRLSPDGKVEVNNGAGEIIMDPSGKVTINGNFEVLP